MTKNLFKIMGALWALIFVCVADAQIRKSDTRVVPLQEQDANQRWKEFSNSRVTDYCMDFELEHAPRRAESEFYEGTIFNVNSGAETVTRISLFKKNSENEKIKDEKPIVEFLILNSPEEHQVWKWENGKLQKLEKSQWFAPMISGLVYSPFDLLSPYKNWNSKYAGPGRIGQAVHFYDLTPNSEYKIFQGNDKLKIGKIRVALSREFNAPVSVQAYSNFGQLVKTLSLGSVKKVEEFWIVSKLELRDDTNMNKDILRFIRGKMRPKFDMNLFKTNSLGKTTQKQKLEEF